MVALTRWSSQTVLGQPWLWWSLVMERIAGLSFFVEKEVVRHVSSSESYKDCLGIVGLFVEREPKFLGVGKAALFIICNRGAEKRG